MTAARPSMWVARTSVAILIATLVTACASRPAYQRRSGGSRLETIGGHFLAGAEMSNTRTEDTRHNAFLLRSEVGVRVAGRVYDPKFLRFSLGGLLGVTYANADFEPYPGYDVSLNFLPEHAYPITFYALQARERGVLERFGPSPIVQTDRKVFGANLGLSLPALIGALRVNRSYLETDGLNSDTLELRDSVSLGFRHTPSRRFRTRFNYVSEWVDQERSEAEDQLFRLQTFLLQNTIASAPSDVLSGVDLHTNLSVFDRTGTSPYRTLTLSEDIRWFPAPELRSRTRYEFSRYEASRDSARHSLGQSFTHYLYESLTTILAGRMSRDELSDGKIRQVGGSLDLRYQKSIPIGMLILQYRGGLERQENNLESATVPVIGEEVTLSIDVVTLLSQQDVVSDSVVVSNADRTTIYDEGLDYRLIRRDRLVEIRRIPGGRILEGDTVLVDYEYQTAPDLTFDTTQHLMSVELYLVEALRLYVRKLTVDQDVVYGDPGRALQDSDDLVLGIDLALGDFRIRGEYEDSDSTYTSFSQIMAEIAYRTEIGRDATIGASVNETRTTYPDGNDLQIDTFQGIVQAKIGRRFLLHFEPAYRMERRRGANLGELNLRLGLSYRYGDWRLELDARYRSIDADARKYGDTFAIFTVARRW